MNFSVIRYLNMLGIEAHLFMFDNEYDHFLPENDTWNLVFWRDKIHVLPFSNKGRSLIKTKSTLIRESLKGYDIYLGCGLAPAYFQKAEMVLDCFTPYDIAIEASYNVAFRDFINHPVRYTLYLLYVKPMQVKGILNVSKTFCISSNPITSESLKRLQIKYLNYSIPMVFNKDNLEEITISLNLEKILSRLKQHDFIVFSHSRQYWKNTGGTNFDKMGGKRNDILIEGFAKFLRRTIYKKPILVLFEYGTDITASKQLISKLGISKNVLWLPLLPRKEIMLLIKHAHVCADQFGAGGYWGSTGWEILSQGKPLLVSLTISSDEYFALTGHELPYIMISKTSDDIAQHLIYYQDNSESCRQMGERNQDWFDINAGIGLAKKYVEVMQQIYLGKQNK